MYGVSVSQAQIVIERFGSQRALAAALGKLPQTIQYWAKIGRIPKKWHKQILTAAKKAHIELTAADLDDSSSVQAEVSDSDEEETQIVPAGPLPEARWPGALTIGDQEIPCYVLDSGARVITQRSAITTISGTKGGSAEDYWGISALKPFINDDLVAEGTIWFSIPGNPRAAKGIGAESFINICNGYVRALKAGALPTPRQREIAINCSMFLAACAKIGLLALIDEATGYQYERAEDALQIKLRAFLEEEMREWEKTFPDELWVEFGRLTNWKGALHSRPKYWGKLVMELVYGYLDADVAEWLKENAPAPKKGQNYHQWLSSQYGLKRLIEHVWMLIGISSTCHSMRELRDKMAGRFGKKLVQLSLPMDIET